MSCCCQKVYKFCNSVNGCNYEGFTEMFTSLPDGNYNVELEFLNGKHLIGITKSSETIETVGSVVLNENYTYTGKVVDASGSVIPLVVDNVSYDCFQFETKTIL